MGEKMELNRRALSPVRMAHETFVPSVEQFWQELE
jgi:hypothetical protein